MKTFLTVSTLLLMSFTGLSQQAAIIPRPVLLEQRAGRLMLTGKTVLVARASEDRKTALLFQRYVRETYGILLPLAGQAGSGSIRFSTRTFIKAPDKDAYDLTVTKNGVVIEGDTHAGTFYGMQTLIQLLPADMSQDRRPKAGLSVPQVVIHDFPRFAYRGMHLDVCRHFFPVAFIKKYIDYLALHKMNYFHWHLTDDQGWRIEIKKYPGLTEQGAYRNGTITGRYPGTGNDNQRYGGFYTQEDIKALVQYAADRYITIVPEIEMPGHSSAAIAAYPWLSCFPGEPTVVPSHPSLASQNSRGKLVQETWGVFDDVYCAGNDSTFVFLQHVLDEVIALFPSPYIHVGGDESPKTNWKRCPRCQERIKALGLKDEHELQSYFVQRMQKYVAAKGRTLVGWDEILEGGLAPDAVVMSWRGEKGGIDAAMQDHQVIMTPQKPVYFDHSQTRNEDSLVIGGYNPLEQVYAYEPVPKLPDSSKARFVLGAQANVWTEYMTNGKKVEYMIFPRMSALSEVLWSPKESRDWSDFEKRLQVQFERYGLWKSNYSTAYYDLKATILPAPGNAGLLWKIEGRKPGDTILFHSFPDGPSRAATTESGSSFEKQGFHILPYDRWIRAGGRYDYRLIRHGIETPPIVQDFIFTKSTAKKISLATPPNEKYPGQGDAFGLVNGIYSRKGLSYPDWLGWIGDDIDATIDLGSDESLDSVRLHTLDQNGSWIYLPPNVEVLTSADGRTFTSAGRASVFVSDTLTMGWINVPLQKKHARYLRVVASNYGLIPDGKPGAGNKAWLFADEIQVY